MNDSDRKDHPHRPQNTSSSSSSSSFSRDVYNETSMPFNFTSISHQFPAVIPVFSDHSANIETSSNHKVRSYPPPKNEFAVNHIPGMNQLEGVFMDSGSGDLDDDKLSKKRRTNYRRPENAAKLNAAVNALIMQKQDPNAPKDIRSVSKIFNIPYNTLRDNYLRFVTSLFFFLFTSCTQGYHWRCSLRKEAEETKR
jgi:hypothetical protein